MSSGGRPRLRADLIVSCDLLLRSAVEAGRLYFADVKTPLRDVEIMVLEPSGPGWSSRPFTHREIDISSLYVFESTILHPSREWKDAKEALQAYVDANDIQPMGFRSPNIQADITQVFRAYVKKAGRLAYRQDFAEQVIKDFLSYLDSSEPEVKGLIILEGFSANKPFKLVPNIEIRLISLEHLIELGRTDVFSGVGLGGGDHIPRTDWWVCEVKLPNPRGTSIAFNKIRDVGHLVALSLRAFKPGGLNYGWATSQIVGPFGQATNIRGGRLDNISMGTGDFYLSNPEILRFQRFWIKFRDIMEAEQHYLQLPIRRLRTAGTRAQTEDALVDYVVGLESLLGKRDDGPEIGYRFRIRGSVILGRTKNDRRKFLWLLRDLYRLRSDIVHGQPVSTEGLDDAIPQAESALRSVWRWYFDHYADEPNNHKGVDSIDEQLVGG